MAFIVRILVFAVVSMAFFNTGAAYLNTGSLSLDPRTVFTVVRLQDNMEDVLKWALIVGDGVVGEAEQIADELRGAS
jgi:heptaprenylglyceryl phosphate synthase